MQLDEFSPAEDTRCPYQVCVSRYTDAADVIEKLGAEDPTRQRVAALMREAFGLVLHGKPADGFAQQSLRQIAEQISEATQGLLSPDDGRKGKKKLRPRFAA